MESATRSAAHNGTTFIHMASRAFDRAGYYGIRGLIVLYMTSGLFAFDSGEALNIYGWIASILIVTEILGGVMGDLVLGNRLTAIIGACLQAFGAFILCLPSEIMLYTAIGFIGLGSGLYSPNLLSLFGKNYLRKQDQLDSGYTLLYLAINIGAAIGALLVAYLGDLNFRIGFATAGVFILLSAAFMLLSPKLNDSEEKTGNKPFLNRALFILAAALISAIFWTLYDAGGMDVNMVQYELLNDRKTGFFTYYRMYSITAYVTIFLLIVFALAWMFFHMNRFLKMALGFVFGGVAFVLYLLVSPEASSLGLVILLVATLFMCLAEVFVGPTVLAMVARYANPRYLAIIFSVVFLPGRFLMWLSGLVLPHMDFGYAPGLKIGCGLYLVAGIAIFALSFILKPNSSATATNSDQ